MSRLFIFGLGYAASAIADAAGGPVLATTRDGRGGTIRFDDSDAVRAGLAAALMGRTGRRSRPPGAHPGPAARRPEQRTAGCAGRCA